MTTKIDSFRDDNYFLSNFYSCPITYEGITYQNTEAAFQSAKCIYERDRVSFASLNPSEAKHLGRSVPLRKDWGNVKVQVMTEIVRAKFDQNPDLAEKLLATGDVYLEEGNDWGDRTWGTVNGVGANLLGQILMQIRAEKQQELTIELDRDLM